MKIELLKAKIHGARVTGADVDYEGSIAIDEALLELSGLVEHEHVHIWNKTNANRFSTYVIKAPKNSRTLALNGAAAKLVQIGDEVIIAAFAHFDPIEAKTHSPTVVLVNAQNVGRLKMA